MRRPKKERQQALKDTIRDNPFVTDEELSVEFDVSVQTIRLDRMELAIPELRERIKHVAVKTFEDEVKSLPIDEVIGEIIDIELDKKAISIFDVKPEHVFQRNQIARGHHLFAQANSLAVAVMNEELALTVKSELQFLRPVTAGQRVVAKAEVVDSHPEKNRAFVKVVSAVDQLTVFIGTFEMYRMTEQSEGDEK
ncbi:transcription factor FapR [Microbacterium sp. APC 3898]|uniref:Transcription factor FapR n=1 Tax=Planococcus notacanthi TaxID=3035188 RepID=A0ABT7ZG44_9BACL|nr:MULTISPECIES: transcription factor FapR [Terrabacteria group]MDN3426125.1 transcription factor FapR [Planococcus sp. APC 4016]MDN3437719.1 transcription factor FapR [Planococcus sp. APC 3900]MDN3497822.1 transcription factor FapR [Microbacterium sp. APC 3898]